MSKREEAPSRPETDSSESKLIAERRAKLDRLREAGPVFPNNFRRSSLASQLHLTYADYTKEQLEEAPIEVRVGGRMRAKRVMGKSSFAKIQDQSGEIQLYVQRDSLADGVYAGFKTWDVGDIVGAKGNLYRTNTGELSVKVNELQLLTKSLRPLPDKWHGLSDQEIRYRQRYVDLIINEQSRDVFRRRSEIVRHIRGFLDAQGYLEVETPMMQITPGGAVARPFVTHHNALDIDLYLRIAPELYLKRLTVGGFERVYEINRNFRNEGVSTQHNPEFTMLELYWAYADFEDLMTMLEGLIRGLAETITGGGTVEYQGRQYHFDKPFRRLSVADAIIAAAPELESDRLRDIDHLREVCAKHEVPVKPGFGAGKLQIELFEALVERSLEDPTYITYYPAEVSPLSRRNDEDPFLTDRFELFIAGREIANGFSELNDPEDQAARFKAQVADREGGDDEAMFFDADYIRALEYGLPPTAGLGVGIDRLVMLLTDSASIRDVLLFPYMRPERGLQD